MVSPPASHLKQWKMLRDGVTEKMMLAAERDLWIGHGPRSSFPPRRLRKGAPPMLSNRSTMETLTFRTPKSIGRRRPLSSKGSLPISSPCGADCGSCANSFIPNPMAKVGTRQHSSSGTESEKRNQSSAKRLHPRLLTPSVRMYGHAKASLAKCALTPPLRRDSLISATN